MSFVDLTSPITKPPIIYDEFWYLYLSVDHTSLLICWPRNNDEFRIPVTRVFPTFLLNCRLQNICRFSPTINSYIKYEIQFTSFMNFYHFIPSSGYIWRIPSSQIWDKAEQLDDQLKNNHSYDRSIPTKWTATHTVLCWSCANL